MSTDTKSGILLIKYRKCGEEFSNNEEYCIKCG